MKRPITQVRVNSFAARLVAAIDDDLAVNVERESSVGPGDAGTKCGFESDRHQIRGACAGNQGLRQSGGLGTVG